MFTVDVKQQYNQPTRCRIGHTRLTHSYLLNNEQLPFCITCNEPFTVKHFLITCTEFNYIRNRYFTAKTVKELFSDTSSDKIINFLKETNLFSQAVIKYFYVLMVIPIVLLILSILIFFSLFPS